MKKSITYAGINQTKKNPIYWSKLYGGQLVESGAYRNLCHTVTINILGFNYVDNDRYHNTFHLREDNTDSS
ncbi:PD-(D/E)XK nuclease family transposase [Alicyclobacillus acidoterrestris]|uniref:PD-(D/E)XK nuclease family transposase n=1 Tax=Alicyclobacillus acidoterrestris TaxID=1450 RepID=UPI0009DBB4C7